MRILKTVFIGISLFIALLFMGLLYSIGAAIIQAVLHGPVEHAHATALSALLASLLEATVYNPLFYAALTVCFLAGYAITKPRTTPKPTS